MKKVLLLVCCMTIFAPLIEAKDNNFSFIALGDTAYNGEEDYKVYEKLISTINDSKPTFSIHVGDTWGVQNCDDKAQNKVLKFFNQYDHPLIYTPGDNEWTDCIDPAIDVSKLTLETVNWDDFAAYQLDRLSAIRRIFFNEAQTLGARRMPVVRQSDVSSYTESVENLRWSHNHVLFLTLHVVGSGNSFNINSKMKADEAVRRDKANAAWINDSLVQLNERKHKAVVISLHAGMFEKGAATGYEAKLTGSKVNGGFHGPYANLVVKIIELAKKFKKPVLLIHGDHHRFVVDRPFLVYQGEEKSPDNANITRVQVYGAPEIRAVKVNVEPDTPWVFSFSPLYSKVE